MPNWYIADGVLQENNQQPPAVPVEEVQDPFAGVPNPLGQWFMPEVPQVEGQGNPQVDLYLAEVQAQMTKGKAEMMKYKMARGVRSTSQSSDEYRDLAAQITELQGSFQREAEELARVLEDISKKVEVVRDIGSIVHLRTTTLLQVASQLEMWRQTLLLPGSPELAKAVPEAHFAQTEVHQPVEAGLKPVAPGLWQLGLV